MTVDEKLQTEVITTERAIDFLKRYDNDEVYTPLCVKSHKMAIEAMNENEGLKKEVKHFKTLHKYIDRNVTKVLVDDEKLMKRNEQLQKEITEIELREQTLHVAIEKAREEMAKRSYSAKDSLFGDGIRWSLDIIDKYLGEKE